MFSKRIVISYFLVIFLVISNTNNALGEGEERCEITNNRKLQYSGGESEDTACRRVMGPLFNNR